MRSSDITVQPRKLSGLSDGERFNNLKCDQACVLSFPCPLHSASNFVNCSLVRIDFASSVYFASLASLQPALICSAMAASIFVFCSGVRLSLANETSHAIFPLFAACLV